VVFATIEVVIFPTPRGGGVRNARLNPVAHKFNASFLRHWASNVTQRIAAPNAR
jgi:hypothetical protein